jgi:predicted RNA-binding protein YlqC (UPF0109 family)
MKNLVEAMVRELVDEPELVHVTQVNGTQSAVLEVRVAKTDIGKVIGRKGRTAQALRTILQAASGTRRLRTTLEIIE